MMNAGPRSIARMYYLLALILCYFPLSSSARADYVDYDCLDGCEGDCVDGCAGGSKAQCIAGCNREHDECEASCTLPGDRPVVTGGGDGSSVTSVSNIEYGNYCGPGHTDDSGQTPPVDAVDAVCRTHDLCYNARGYSDCGCDRELIFSMPDAISGTQSLAAKVAGVVAKSFFMAAPCACQICFYSYCFSWPLGVGGVGPC